MKEANCLRETLFLKLAQGSLAMREKISVKLLYVRSLIPKPPCKIHESKRSLW